MKKRIDNVFGGAVYSLAGVHAVPAPPSPKCDDCESEAATIYVVIGRDYMDPRRGEREEAETLDEAYNIAAMMEADGLSVTITEDNA